MRKTYEQRIKDALRHGSELAAVDVGSDADADFAALQQERDALQRDVATRDAMMTDMANAKLALRRDRDALREALNGVVQEMRESERAAGQFATDGPDDVFTAMASAEAERLSGWADRIVAALATSQKGS